MNAHSKQPHAGHHADTTALTNLEALHTMALASGAFSVGLLVGGAIGFLSARQLNARFDWAALWLAPLGIAVATVELGLLAGRPAVISVGALVGLFAGHLVAGVAVHWQDLQAGDDRAHQARQRIGPHHMLRRRSATARIAWAVGKGSRLAIGTTRRGGIATIKRGSDSGSHCLIVGTTGAGKSTLLGVLALEYALSGHAIVIVEAKTDRGLEQQVREAAQAAGREFVLISPDGPVIWDVLANGETDEIVAKLLACETYSEPHHEAMATRFLRWVIRTMRSSGERLTLRKVLGVSEPDRLAAFAAEHGDPELVAEVEEYLDTLSQRERADLGGLRGRLGVLAESDFGRRWLDPEAGAGPVVDLGTAIRNRACVYVRLDAERNGIVAEKVGAAIAIELGAVASELQGNPIETFVGIDEFGAIEAKQADRLFARGRGAGFSVAIAVHTLKDLAAADEAFEGRIEATIDTALGLQMGPYDADAVARLAGQVGDWQQTSRTAGLLGGAQMVGTRTRGYRLRVHPSVLQHLGWGECAVIDLSQTDNDRVAIARVLPGWERKSPNERSKK